MSANDFIISPDISAIEAYPASKEPLKLGVLASGSGTNFEAVMQAIADGKLNAKVHVLIYNKSKAKAVDRARCWNVPAVLLKHRDYPNREAFDRQIVQTLKQHDVDWVVMAGWMRIATAELLNPFPNRVINIHPSLLPSFPGTHGVGDALKSGVKITGCTVHLASLAVDSGPVLIQAAVPILPDDTSETLHARIQVQEHEILPRAIAIAAMKHEQ